MAARLTKRLADQTRDGIQTSMLIKRVYGHALGEVEMTATQLRAAEILLKKTLPDLQSIDHTGDVTFTDASQLSRQELERIAASGSAGVVETAGRDGEPPAVH